jgi:hypothetical protein
MRSKLAGLLFLDPSVAKMVQIIDDTLNKLPKYGAITGDDLAMIAGLLRMQLATMGRVITDKQEVNDKDASDIIAPPQIIIPNDIGNVAPIAWDF